MREPKDITLFEVIEALDGTDFFDKCFLGIAGCGEIEPCPFHNTWKGEREMIKNWMKKTTFEDIKNSMTDAWFDLRLKFGRRH